jgi:hypothetical protein
MWGQYSYRKSDMANTSFWLQILWVILLFYFSGLLQKSDRFGPLEEILLKDHPSTSSELIFWRQRLLKDWWLRFTFTVTRTVISISIWSRFQPLLGTICFPVWPSTIEIRWLRGGLWPSVVANVQHLGVHVASAKRNRSEGVHGSGLLRAYQDAVHSIPLFTETEQKFDS